MATKPDRPRHERRPATPAETAEILRGDMWRFRDARYVLNVCLKDPEHPFSRDVDAALAAELISLTFSAIDRLVKKYPYRAQRKPKPKRKGK